MKMKSWMSFAMLIFLSAIIACGSGNGSSGSSSNSSNSNYPYGSFFNDTVYD